MPGHSQSSSSQSSDGSSIQHGVMGPTLTGELQEEEVMAEEEVVAAAAVGVLVGVQETIPHHLIQAPNLMRLSKDGDLDFGAALPEEQPLATWREIETTTGGKRGIPHGDGVLGLLDHSPLHLALARAPVQTRPDTRAQVSDRHGADKMVICNVRAEFSETSSASIVSSSHEVKGQNKEQIKLT